MGETKHVNVSREYDGFTTVGTEPNFTDVDDSNTEKRSVVNDEKFSWLQSLISRMPPRAQDMQTDQLLAQIIDLMSQDRQVSVPSDFTHPRSYPRPANTAGSVAVEGLTSYGHFYIPPHDVPLTVWLGHGTGQPLATVPAGEVLNATIPHVDVITISHESNPTAFTINIYPSTRPFVVRGSMGNAGVVSPSYTSSSRYDSSTAFGGSYNAGSLLGANVLRIIYFAVEYPLLGSNIGIDVTVAGLAGTVARLGLYRFNPTLPEFPILIDDVGTVPVDAIGLPTVAFDYLYLPGTLYGLAYLSNGAPNIRLITDGRNIAGTPQITTIASSNGISQPLAFGPLPTSPQPPWTHGAGLRIFITAA